ncbi:hypothetical protein WJX72_003229 [[Myrmecia] bisecta]|uniref:DDB1- and CUL4-associated factor 12 beta-propeller domain-containing protein n=1 Tax=[Myrmecia] bisecta TaxID=41462 RepID=A0AAW1PB92_9CHLO
MPSQKQSPVLHHVLGSQIARQPRSQLTATVRQALANKLPCLLQEKEFPCKDWKKFDKAFACEWLTEQHVILEPVQTLVGHQDWVFGAAWVTERHVATGSRDCSVKLWTIHDDPYSRSKPNMEPVISTKEHKGKVRDLKFCRQSNQLTTLGSDGTVKLWDRAMAPLRSFKMKFDKELVCMAISDGLIAVGSQSHVTLLDPRLRKGEVRVIESLDENQGVRSINFLEHLLSCGSGRGRISFYDLRASKYIPLELDPDMTQATCTGSLPRAPPLSAQRQYLQAGPGWLCQNDVFLEHFDGQPVYNACYAHAWDMTKTKLMCVGGPLAFGLKGCYMALWD